MERGGARGFAGNNAPFRDPFDIFAQFFGADMSEGPHQGRGVGGGCRGMGGDMFGRSVFNGPGGVRVVVGQGTSPTSILLQMLVSGVERWASQQRQQQAAKRDAEQSAAEHAADMAVRAPIAQHTKAHSILTPNTLSHPDALYALVAYDRMHS